MNNFALVFLLFIFQALLILALLQVKRNLFACFIYFLVRFILQKKNWYWTTQTNRECEDTGGKHAMDTDKVKIYGARVRVDYMARVSQIETIEKEKMREKVQKIIGHGINYFVKLGHCNLIEEIMMN